LPKISNPFYKTPITVISKTMPPVLIFSLLISLNFYPTPIKFCGYILKQSSPVITFVSDLL